MNNNKSIFSWALYDFANSAFAITVISGFFPLFFKFFWANNLNAQESTYYLGLGNSIAGIIIFIISPLLGAISDKGENKKRFLFFFASLGIIACAFLAKIPMGRLFSSSIWENLRLEAGYLLLNAELVVQQKQQSNPQTTAINQEDYAVIGFFDESAGSTAFKSNSLGDRRFMVSQTQTGSRTVGTEVSTTIRVPAPAAVYLRFIYRF